MSIEENNKLIAEFMELNYSYFDKTIQKHFYYTPEEYKIWFDKHQNEITPDEMLYHKSWDWLMPVVEKIQGLYETEECFGGIIDITTTHIQIRIGNFIYCDSKPQKDWKPFDIKRVYKAVIQFIKWYNGQKD